MTINFEPLIQVEILQKEQKEQFTFVRQLNELHDFVFMIG